jgi:hypothetical protein
MKAGSRSGHQRDLPVELPRGHGSTLAADAAWWAYTGGLAT